MKTRPDLTTGLLNLRLPDSDEEGEGDMTAHRSPEERRADGKALRETVPRSSHGDWSPAAGRPDPVEVITSQDANRVQALVPIRHGRMAVSPFTFYRGAAKIMAGDLASTQSTGLDARLCGDAHLANLGRTRRPTVA